MDYMEIVEKGRRRMKELGVYDRYFTRGAESGATLRINREFFGTMRFKFNIIDALLASTETEIFGCKLKTPVMSAAFSTGAELQKITDSPLVMLAQGVKEAGSMMFVGISSEKQLESVVETGVPTVKIVKPYNKHELVIQKIEHAERVGVKAVGMDIDFIIGAKDRDTVRRADVMGPKTSKDLRDFVSVTKLPFILKGVLGKKDAEKAVDIGAKCIVVSNHGSSVLDYAAHSLEVLPDIKSVSGDKMKVFVDGGFRRGTDVLKALALGADGVLVGRLLLLGLAANLNDGVRDIMKAVTAELQRAMTLTGCGTLTDVNQSILERSNYIPHSKIEE